MDINERIGDLLSVEITDQLTMNILSKVCIIAAIIASICFVCSLAWNYLSSAFDRMHKNEEETKFARYNEIAKGFLHIVCISIYPVIALALAGSIEFFNQMSSPLSESNEKLTELAQTYIDRINLSYEEMEMEAIKETAEGKIGDQNDKSAAQLQLQNNPSDPERSSALIEETNGENVSTFRKLINLLNPANWISLAIQAVFTLLFGAVRGIVASIAAVMFKFFIIIGPLAFAFSILPAFEKQLTTWFGSLLNTGFVFMTLNILDMLTLGMFEFIIDGHQGTPVSPGYAIAFNSVSLITYASAFWLTSKFIGKGDAGRVLSKLVGAGTAAAMLMTGGAGAVGGASNITNVASSAGNSLSNKK